MVHRRMSGMDETSFGVSRSGQDGTSTPFTGNDSRPCTGLRPSLRKYSNDICPATGGLRGAERVSSSAHHRNPCPCGSSYGRVCLQTGEVLSMRLPLGTRLINDPSLLDFFSYHLKTPAAIGKCAYLHRLKSKGDPGNFCSSLWLHCTRFRQLLRRLPERWRQISTRRA
jgi:hypothetical protein